LLDFQKLIPQIVALAEKSSEENNRDRQILSLAQASYEEACAGFTQLEKVLNESVATTFWTAALPLEPLARNRILSPCSGSHSVVACDGSQIMPTQHEVHSCFLLNVGSAVIHYGSDSQARLLTFPYLYHSHDDLYRLINGRRIHMDETLVSFERGLKELQQAFELAAGEQAAGHAVLTLLDGSLIPFRLERHAEGFQQELLQQFQSRLSAFREARLPLLGYISHSRSADVANILRVWRCPYPERRCQSNCGLINEEDYPCSQIWPLSDRHLFASKLPKNAGSSFFLSGARWSGALNSADQICFSYLNFGQEAARIELPYWLFEDENLLEFSLAALTAQVRKGQGYPISLSEAHNMAVIRQADRNRFYELVAAQLLETGKTAVSLSPKESKKRRGIV
jgi:hypothetical protein